MAIKFACRVCTLHMGGWSCDEQGHDAESCKALGLTKGLPIPLMGCSHHDIDGRECESDTCPDNNWHRVVSRMATCDA